MNVDSAKVLLRAIQNPKLTLSQAMAVAKMYGNQGAIRKLNEFKIAATTESLADALYAAARGQKVSSPAESSFYLDEVRSKAPQLLSLIEQIEANRDSFEAAISGRIGMFTPPNTNLILHGYAVAAGDGGGYAFGTTDFYLNVGIIDELIVAKNVAAHELYHAMQGAFANAREQWANERIPTDSARLACASTERLFAKLYEEGSATEVEDVSLLAQAHSAIGIKKEAALREGLTHLHRSIELLEMSVVSLNAEQAMPFDEVYGVGFYGDGTLYDTGYVMAKAITENDGPQGLAIFLRQPPYKFLLRYTQLPKYGTDQLPRLGPNTITAARHVASGCH